jgi:hypothetical protein
MTLYSTKLPLAQPVYLMSTLQHLLKVSTSRRRGVVQDIPALTTFGSFGGVDTTMAGSEVV